MKSEENWALIFVHYTVLLLVVHLVVVSFLALFVGCKIFSFNGRKKRVERLMKWCLIWVYNNKNKIYEQKSKKINYLTFFVHSLRAFIQLTSIIIVHLFIRKYLINQCVSNP